MSRAEVDAEDRCIRERGENRRLPPIRAWVCLARMPWGTLLLRIEDVSAAARNRKDTAHRSTSLARLLNTP